ncbi:MAG: XRE family transcriptional regulator [Bythopirellula sp.]|nr:XRE family transcriptional regulator [Bythopirellula sp.]
MRPGTPGFNGERLKAAREARGLSATGLSEIVGVTKSAISQYERGEQTPSPLVLKGIAERLNLPQHFFTKPSLKSTSTIFYRSFSSALKSSRTRAERRFEWLQEIVTFLKSQLDFSALNIPYVKRTPLEIVAITPDEIEELATSTRRALGIGDGPIKNVVRLLENQGVVITRHYLDSEKLDAFSNWSDGDDTAFIVLGSDKKSAVRSRFDALHELAHLILHRELDESFFKDRERFRIIESQADRFAGAMLLPTRTFLGEVASLTPEALLSLKERWGASVGLMIKRCEAVGLISEERLQLLWISISKRGWRKWEPLDSEIPVEEPQFLKRCFELLFSERIVDAGSLTSFLPWSIAEIEDLAGLEAGSLHQAPLDDVLPRLRLYTDE